MSTDSVPRPDLGRSWSPPRPGAAGDAPCLRPDEQELVLHDVRNALTAALGHAQLLRRRSRSGGFDGDLDALQAIEVNVLRAVDLLAGPPRRDASTCDLVAVARQSAAQAPPERAGDVAVKRPQDALPTVVGDALAVARILANLVDNAAKYSAPGTPIEITFAAVGDGVELVVRDRGIGVPDAELEAIFAGHRTLAARRTAAGHGLGLRSSRRLADRMGGRLWAAREPGGGTALHLWLPAA